MQVKKETRFKLLIWQCGFSALTIVYIHSTSAHSNRGVRLWNTLNLCTSLVGVTCRLEAKAGAKNTRSSNVIYRLTVRSLSQIKNPLQTESTLSEGVSSSYFILTIEMRGYFFQGAACRLILFLSGRLS